MENSYKNLSYNSGTKILFLIFVCESFERGVKITKFVQKQFMEFINRKRIIKKQNTKSKLKILHLVNMLIFDK